MTSPLVESKRCSKCGQIRPLDQFHRQPSGEMGRHSWCKDCFNAWARETRKRNYSTEQKQRWLLSTRYRLTPDQVQAMSEAQGGVCAICRQPMARVCIDHNHQTGAVRGLLCHHGNIRLAVIEDEPYRTAALAYLKQHA